MWNLIPRGTGSQEPKLNHSLLAGVSLQVRFRQRDSVMEVKPRTQNDCSAPPAAAESLYSVCILSCADGGLREMVLSKRGGSEMRGASPVVAPLSG